PRRALQVAGRNELVADLAVIGLEVVAVEAPENAVAGLEEGHRVLEGGVAARGSVEGVAVFDRLGVGRVDLDLPEATGGAAGALDHRLVGGAERVHQELAHELLTGPVESEQTLLGVLDGL